MKRYSGNIFMRGRGQGTICTWLLPVLLLLCAMASIASAGEIVTREVIASGLTRQDAVLNGLIEALQQVRGVSLDAAQDMRHALQVESEQAVAGIEEEHTAFSDRGEKDIQSKTKGYIASYEVLEIRPKQGGAGFETRLLVNIPRFVSRGLPPETRRRLAIMPFRTTTASFVVGDESMPAAELTRRFTHMLVNAFTQSRRFNVLDRDYVAERTAEKEVIRSPEAAGSELVQLGNELGADYLLVGSITAASLVREPFQIQISGESGSRYRGAWSLDYRIILLATGQAKWSGSVVVDLDDKMLLSMAGSAGSLAIIETFFAAPVSDLVRQTLENIYPIQVVGLLDDGSVVLNQGGDGVSTGGVFEVFQNVEPMVDPDSGESLGHSEQRLGLIEIERVTAKMAYAKIVEGDAGQIGPGVVCRRVQGGVLLRGSAVGTAPPVIPGVRLPFD